jgi:hypothetical protein
VAVGIDDGVREAATYFRDLIARHETRSHGYEPNLRDGIVYWTVRILDGNRYLLAFHEHVLHAGGPGE